VARALNIPLANIRVNGHYMGGGFGAKLSHGKYSVMAALLAKKTARPVRLFLSREQVCLSMGNRPANTITLKAGVKKDGTLVALQSKSVGSGGAYSDGGTGGVDYVIRELYACPNVRCENQSVYIHAGPERPFRAPGHPQGAWALEIMLDALAAKLGMDPIALRLKNVTLVSQTRNGNPKYTSTGFADCLKNGAQTFGWAEARARQPLPSHIRRGVGVAGGMWQGGGGSPPATAIVKLFADGSANLNMGASDIGCGTKTWGAQIVAEELGVPMDRISVEHADTGTTQFATPSGGSKTVPTESPAIRSAALDVKQQLLTMAAEQLKLPAADLELRGAEVVSKTDATKKVALGQIQAFSRRGLLVGIGYRVPNPPGTAVNPFGAQFAEVEVNTKTGEIRVLRFLAAHDSGRILNEKMFRNQVFGGVTMGIGFGLTEDRVMDDGQLGKLLTVNLHDYKMPTALDAPADKTMVIVDPHDHAFSNTGAKGVGEPATIPTAPAIANAVFHATGLLLTDAPMSPARVLRALEARQQAAAGQKRGK
jgi:xanthine dehydrogenase YagR molybdenum-binding subunit